MQFPNLERVGWNNDVVRSYEEHTPAGLEPGRVSVQHRGAWEVATETGSPGGCATTPRPASSPSSATGSPCATA